MSAWLAKGLSVIGTKEAPGPTNNPTIIGWAKRLGVKTLGMVYNADSTPWCGVFVAHCIREAGLTPPAIPVRAKSWATWEANLSADKLVPGAVLVFERKGGGHVAFYVGEDRDCYHVCGGNQSDAVNITRIEKSRCVARRWPRGIPVVGKRVFLDATGKVSKNEA